MKRSQKRGGGGTSDPAEPDESARGVANKTRVPVSTIPPKPKPLEKPKDPERSKMTPTVPPLRPEPR